MNEDRNMDLAHYFGEEPARVFWGKLAALGLDARENGGVIELAPFKSDLASFAGGLVGALEALLESDRIARFPEKDAYPEQARAACLRSPYGDVHAALFAMSSRFEFVWVVGWEDYMVRTAHKIHPSSGVSLVSSDGPSRLLLGQIR